MICLAMVGMAVMSGIVGDAWSVGGYLISTHSDNWNSGAELGWDVSGAIVSSLYGFAVGAAFGAAPGALVGFIIAL